MLDHFLDFEPNCSIGKHFQNTTIIGEGCVLQHRHIFHKAVVDNVLHDLVHKVDLIVVQRCVIQELCLLFRKLNAIFRKFNHLRGLQNAPMVPVGSHRGSKFTKTSRKAPFIPAAVPAYPQTAAPIPHRCRLQSALLRTRSSRSGIQRGQAYIPSGHQQWWK